MFSRQSPESVLFVTLDSCRYDTFMGAVAPNLKGVGPVHRAMAPGNFTYSSHAAMFMGFTPGVAQAHAPFVNPKFGKLFKVVGGGHEGRVSDHFTLSGRNIIDGFKRIGYRAVGTGAVGWFDPETDTGRNLTQDFDRFKFLVGGCSLPGQLEWLSHQLSESDEHRFVFLNIGETHVPYYYAGAPWPREINPCVPFSTKNDAEECRRRQKACVEHVDTMLAPLLDAFQSSTVLICADHGDCWGEDGLWEHGFHHDKVLEVPLIFRTSVISREGAE